MTLGVGNCIRAMRPRGKADLSGLPNDRESAHRYRWLGRDPFRIPAVGFAALGALGNFSDRADFRPSCVDGGEGAVVEGVGGGGEGGCGCGWEVLV